MSAATTLVRPIVEYASAIWDPFTEDTIRKLEMVQRRAARMVYADYKATSKLYCNITSALPYRQTYTNHIS